MQFTRRSLLTAGSAAAIAGALPMAETQAAAPPVGKQAPGFYRFKIGDFEVTAIHDGYFDRAVEGVVKNVDVADVRKALEAGGLPTDKFRLMFTTLVVNTGSKLVLLDAGFADNGPPTTGTWMANFMAAGYDPKNVDTIIVSHFHPDHINGIRKKDGTAVFANAEVMVPKGEWAFWMDDAKMNSAPDAMKPSFATSRRVFGPIAKDVTQFDTDKEVAPGITAIATPGHTLGHTSFMVSSGSGKLFVTADLTNHPAIFVRNPQWLFGSDMDGEQAKATKIKMLDMAATEKTQVSFYHAPFPATGFIVKDGQAYNLVPAPWNAVL
jgi:glyoxylase-like metal-dependent hydrolase (beta-lactamase superfamily II)